MTRPQRSPRILDIELNRGLAGFACLLLLGALFVSCGNNDEPASPAADSETSDAGSTEAAEEEPSKCLTLQKGPVEKLQAGKADGDVIDRVTFAPHNLRLPAGRFVTIKITNPSSIEHEFTAEALDCTTDKFGTGESVSVSFKVPKGETDFYCALHEVMTGNIIGVK